MNVADRPNVLGITCRDLGRFLGCYGVWTVSTPCLDALSVDGVRFAPSSCGARFGWDLQPTERDLARVLLDAGYVTALVGNHHEGRFPAGRGARRLGFESVAPGGRADAVTTGALNLLTARVDDGQPFYLQTRPIFNFLGPMQHDRDEGRRPCGCMTSGFGPDRLVGWEGWGNSAHAVTYPGARYGEGVSTRG